MTGGLAGVIAEPAVQLQRIVQVTVGVIPATQVDESLAEELMHNRLRSRIAETVSGDQRQLLAPCPVGVVPAAVEVFPQHGGELPCVGIETAVCGGGSRRHQHPVLGLQPGAGLLWAGEAFGWLARPWWRLADLVGIGVYQAHRVTCGIQVVIQHPAHRAAALLVVTKTGGVGAQQVVQREPDRGPGGLPAAGTSGPRRRPAAGRTRRTPPGRRRPDPRYPASPGAGECLAARRQGRPAGRLGGGLPGDRKSTRLNSSHVENSYAVFCLKKKKEGISSCAASDSTGRTSES